MDIASFIFGAFVENAIWYGCSGSRKPAAPTPAPKPRDVGDLLLQRASGIPILLVEKVSHDKFKACYITEHASTFGAKVADEQKDELELFAALNVNDRDVWPDYPHPLSDTEHANYAKAMLK
jgi:hypothetical protein